MILFFHRHPLPHHLKHHHGGSGRDHGAQVYEHRTTWVACNREIDSRYFGNGYDGYNEDH